MMHIEFFYQVPTYFNPALARMVTTLAEVTLKTHFRVDLSILGLMLGVLECRLVSWEEGRFFALQCWWLGCQVRAAVAVLPPHRHMSNEVQGVLFQLCSEIPAQHSHWV